MKKVILLFWIFFSLSAFAQQSIISKYERADVNHEGKQYAKLLNIDNKNNLIIKLEDEKFVVFDDNAVYRFYLDQDKRLNKTKLAIAESTKSFRQLDSLKSINPYNLNVTRQMKTDSLNSAESIDVQDGFSYRLSLFRNDLTVNYETYSPEIYIEKKFPFYKERAKLLNAYKYFASLYAQNNSKKRDSVFLVFDCKTDPSVGMSRSYYPEGKEIFSAWNKRGDSLIFIGKENVEVKQSFFKDKKAKIFYVSKLIAVDIFYALKPIENKIIFMIDGNLLSKKVKLIKIDETKLSERPQE